MEKEKNRNSFTKLFTKSKPNVRDRNSETANIAEQRKNMKRGNALSFLLCGGQS